MFLDGAIAFALGGSSTVVFLGSSEFVYETSKGLDEEQMSLRKLLNVFVNIKRFDEKTKTVQNSFKLHEIL